MTTYTSDKKYLVNCQDGKNNVERASIAFVLAATASKTCETAVFITADAAHLCTQGGADGMVYEGMEPVAELMNQFLGNGGKIWLCPVCATVKNITPDDLITGVEIAGAPKTMAFIESGATVLH
jgi:predicted peroxiredoxin